MPSADLEGFGAAAIAGLATAAPLPRREPTPAEIRAWALGAGWSLSAKGRVPAEVRSAWIAALGTR
ncbi:Lsr2 family DNA-binding protein [Aeromicrobium sp.]|uniref:Lsr2 family DNA-binding protein n=1 Tax=Aeromicrobium sp. TaxID=1871063 RepID=UPI003FA60A44